SGKAYVNALNKIEFVKTKKKPEDM
ncbi:MAG: hypothetical protein H6Q55_270, partial [Deltaproteobacteria bacterium]|nr:hypothetical protein [Deltaproteobacteria bacterium]